jgi:UDP-N-acetylglucosamine:LPS N-acetylglucosamine transferase
MGMTLHSANRSNTVRKTRVMLVCSAGGHLAEMQRLLPAFDGCRLSLVTYRSSRGPRPIDGVTTYLVENIGSSPIRLLRALPAFIRALWCERPHVIVSTGSEIAIPLFYLARSLGIKTLYIESWCRVRTPSGTGRLVYPVADRFFVQWEPLLERYGPRAELSGRLL